MQMHTQVYAQPINGKSTVDEIKLLEAQQTRRSINAKKNETKPNKCSNNDGELWQFFFLNYKKKQHKLINATSTFSIYCSINPI